MMLFEMAVMMRAGLGVGFDRDLCRPIIFLSARRRGAKLIAALRSMARGRRQRWDQADRRGMTRTPSMLPALRVMTMRMIGVRMIGMGMIVRNLTIVLLSAEFRGSRPRLPILILTCVFLYASPVSHFRSKTALETVQ